MKKYYLIIVLLFSVVISSCFEGRTTDGGKTLKKYLEPEELKELIDSKNDSIWIIDVRPLSNYKKGHIPSAKSFPSSDILKRLEEIPKDKKLILHCETGGRAQMVLKKLKKKGYTKIMNWGSYKKWEYELVKEE